MTDPERSSQVTTRNRVGLGIAAVLGLADCTSLAFTTPDGEVGPPIAVLILTTICGLVTLVATVPAWRRGDRPATRLVAGSRIVSAVAGLPVFFVDIDPALVVLAAVGVALTVIAVVLMLTPARRTVAIED